MFPMRLNKFLAQAGYASRREADRLIESGKVFINGRMAKLGAQVRKLDEVTINGRQIIIEEEAQRWYAYNKPVGVIASIDEKTTNNLRHNVPIDEKFYPAIGMDVANSGLIILAPDGPIAQKIALKSKKMEKEYQILLQTEVSTKQIQDLKEGMVIKNKITEKPIVKSVGPKKLMITVREAHDEELAVLLRGLDINVQKITRVRCGPIKLENAKVGEIRLLTDDEVAELKRLLV